MVDPLTTAPSGGLYRWARPFLFRLGAEQAHELTLGAAERFGASAALCAAARRVFPVVEDEALHVQAFGLDFPNPIGLAAGLDKDGVAIDFWAALGFGFVEVGTVTPGSGQPGNEGPRLARFPAQGALVNRMGFNNQGAPALAGRLARRRTRIPVGANIGKAKVTPLEDAASDYEAAARDVGPRSNFLVINVSSPNTPGLRSLQAVEALEPILEAVRRADSGRPILLKVAPDLDDEALREVGAWVKARQLDGVIASNTTQRLDLLHREAPFAGGLSGRPLAPRALEVVRVLYEVLGQEVPIIGVGGIDGPDAAYARIRAGARLVQIYTGFVYGGPALIGEIAFGLLQRLKADGFQTIEEAVGADENSRKAACSSTSVTRS
ncbi:MAG: quinone-dependent dihydroorotate dehydrogenase [Myxococcota bacterium]